MDLLCWIFIQVNQIPRVTHYLDDYFFIGSSKLLCGMFLQTAISSCDYLNVPLALNKMEGPSTVLTYLGIQIDSEMLTISLPPVKLANLLQLLNSWAGRHTCSKKELLSLIGSLSFACKVVKPGRTFLRRLIDLSSSVARLADVLVLQEGALLDLQWWSDFVVQWNGREVILQAPVTSAQWGLYTDASDIGMGGVAGGKWFSSPWDDKLVEKHINVKELFAVATAIFTWGKDWRDMEVVIFTDNKPITQIWHTGATQNRDVMVIIRKLFYFLAHRNVNIKLEHVYGYKNIKADLLSRLQVLKFKETARDAEEEATPIPAEVWGIFTA